MANEITLEDIRRMAGEVGLTRLTDEHLQQLLRATRAAYQRRSALLTAELVPADEPAHVYSITRHAPQ